MKKFGKWVVRLRIPIVIISLLLLIPSFFGIINTRVNYDILSYLPDDLETMKGQDILLDEFGKGAYSIFVCNGMKEKDVIKMKEQIEEVDHVVSVLSFDSLFDPSIPIDVIPEKIKDVFYSSDEESSLMFIFYDSTTSSDETLEAVGRIRSIAGERCFLSGMSGIVADTQQLITDEMFWYVVIAAVLAILVLGITLDSFVVPFIILLNIGMSILYNLGTNVFKGEVSFLTMALVAVLQLGVTMDYSIFLYSSYKEKKRSIPDGGEAMAEAVSATFSSITGSSLTTIAGFAALCFMSFKLGLDLGLVMAKGVILGVIGCVTILPAFLLCFDKLIAKTTHRPLRIRTSKIAGFVTRHRVILFALMLVLWIPAAYGNSNYNVYYKLDTSLPEDMPSVKANKALEDFDISSMSMILADKDMSSKEARQMIDEIKSIDGIEFVLGLDSVAGNIIPEEMIPEEAKEILESDEKKLIVYSSGYEIATDEVNEQCEKVNAVIKKYDPEGMLIGETACTKDLIKVCDHDFRVVSAVSIAAIFILLLFVLKSISLPVILVAVIELAIFINMGMSYYFGQTLPFIASVCVGTIQLGATVDYAILMTNRYKLERMNGSDRSGAAKIAVKTSVQSIFSSAAGMFAATAGVGIYSSADMIASICILLGRGAIVSMFVVVLFLPASLIMFDKVICRSTIGMKKCIAGNIKSEEEEENYEI
ncbi:MAG: efflux RND transporter permease subunit [Lachnospiraceae bacterium]|jgi:predicted RND superfamily exporter protein